MIQQVDLSVIMWFLFVIYKEVTKQHLYNTFRKLFSLYVQEVSQKQI